MTASPASSASPAPPVWIGGEPVAGEAGTYPVRNPARPAEVVLEAPAASAAQVDAAVRAAQAAGPAWAALDVEARCEQVVAAVDAAVAAVAGDEAIAAGLTRENGKVLAEATFELLTVGAVARTFADLAPDALAGRVVPGGGRLDHEPAGVVAALLPFNWPVSVLVTKAAPALIAGNTVVVKPPPTCPGTVLALAAEIAARLPAGVLGTVNGPGPEVGQALVEHPGVGMVSLTGGPRTGRAVMGAAARHLAPVLLELGGNDPAIVGPDVEPSDAVAGELLAAALLTSGQVCVALKRLYVPADRHAQWVEALAAQAAATVTGDGLAEETTVGPLHTAAAAAAAEAMLDQAAAAGARVLRPGVVREPDREAGGHLVPPAIVDGPDRDEPVVTGEQFAPLLPVLAYRDVDDAVDAANASDYGLAASVWTADDELADDVARRLAAGTVFRNAHGPGFLDPRLPVGGWKQSGIGVEFGPEGLRAYTRPRSILGPRPLPGP